MRNLLCLARRTAAPPLARQPRKICAPFVWEDLHPDSTAASQAATKGLAAVTPQPPSGKLSRSFRSSALIPRRELFDTIEKILRSSMPGSTAEDLRLNLHAHEES